MKKFISEFKEFIARGNVIDMAVGIIVGSAFTSIVNTLVTKIIQPFVSLIFVSVRIATHTYDSQPAQPFGIAVPGGTEWIDFGALLTSLLNFLIISFVVFCMVKGISVMRAKMSAVIKKEAQEAEDAKPAPVTCPWCLEEVKPQARKCAHCGSELTPVAEQYHEQH